jgi:hypothetical protein
MSSWQVFGLTGRLLAPASQSFSRLLPVQRMSQFAIALKEHGFYRGPRRQVFVVGVTSPCQILQLL